MFDLAEKPQVWIAVTWPVLRPGAKPDDLAVTTDVTIDVEVELLDRDTLVDVFELGELVEEVAAATPEEEVAALVRAAEEIAEAGETVPANAREAQRKKNVDRFMRLVSNWRKIKNGSKSLPFTRANVEQMYKVPGFPVAFETAYLAAISGKADLRRGN